MDLVNAKRAARALPYVGVKDALKAPVLASDGSLDARVFEGTSVKRPEAGTFLVFQDGGTQQAIPVAALSAAIYHGVIPRAGIEALWAAAKADEPVEEVVETPAPAPAPAPEEPTKEPQASTTQAKKK